MSVYEYSAKTAGGEEVPLRRYEGKVLLIVNTATGCGFTPQYDGLEKLYADHSSEGFEILDFPCNQFGNQAPGSDEEIHEFCTLRFSTTFPRFAKIDVNGENAIPLYTYLKSTVAEEAAKGVKNRIAMKAISKMSKTAVNDNDIKWNFTKFLVDRKGEVVKRFAPTAKPEEIEADIKALLEEQ